MSENTNEVTLSPRAYYLQNLARNGPVDRLSQNTRHPLLYSTAIATIQSVDLKLLAGRHRVIFVTFFMPEMLEIQLDSGLRLRYRR